MLYWGKYNIRDVPPIPFVTPWNAMGSLPIRLPST